jgi:hypothetical protein
VKKAVLAAVVAAAAAAGVVVAIVLSGGGGNAAAPPASRGSTAGATTLATIGVTTSSEGTTATTSPAREFDSATAPVDTTHIDLPPPPKRHSRRTRTFLVGTVDDALAQDGFQFARAQSDVSRDAGFDVAAVSATWHRGQRRLPPPAFVRVLRNAGAATKRAHEARGGLLARVGRDTPRGPAERADFAAYSAAVVARHSPGCASRSSATSRT